MNKSLSLLCLVFIFITMGACSAQPAPQTSGGTKLSATAIIAGEVAITAFKNALGKDHSLGELGAFVSSIDNYQVIVGEGGDTYTFTFLLKEYQGRRLNGGGGIFVVRKSDYKLLDAQMSK